MNQIKIFIITFLCVIVFAFSAFADEPKITPLKKGQFAPWSGVLFSNEAAAEVAATYKTIPEKVVIERKNEREKCDAECKKTVSDMLARHDRKVAVDSAQIERLEAEKTQLSDLLREEEKKSSNTVWWAGIGVASGVIFTIATVFIVNKVTND